MACRCGNLEAVNYLLLHVDIKVDAKDKNEDTPLHEACLHGEKTIVEKLLQKMKEKRMMISRVNTMRNKSGLTPFHLACREGHFAVVELLLDSCGSQSACLITAEDSENGYTPLHFACQNVNEKKAKLIVQKLMSYEGTNSITKPLASACCKDGLTPIHIAAQHGHTSVMDVLLAKAKNSVVHVEVKDNFNQTPMHFAAEYGRVEMLKLLHK